MASSRSFVLVVAPFALAALIAACGSTPVSPSPTDDASVDAAPARDAAADVPDGAPPPSDAAPACDGDCRKTSLEAVYGQKTAGFTRAQHGWDKKNGVVSGVQIEAHFGGNAECPRQNSPTPDRTLIVSGIPVGSAGRTLSLADGIAVTLLDFKNALTDKPLDKSTAATVKVVAIEGEPPENVVLDLEATFDGGTIRGHVFAEHCTTMDE